MDLRTRPTPGARGAPCTSNGHSCAVGQECCSGRCEATPSGQTCVAAKSCAGDGANCQVAADCCSLGCSAGKCSASVMCGVKGGDCSTSHCCSNRCDGGRCALAGQCRPFGETCQSNNDCCSQRCSDDSRCLAGGKCRSEGEMSARARTAATANATTGAAQCSECDPVGQACETSDKCCSRACVDDGTGYKSCQYLGGCRPAGELCRQDSECCNFNASQDPKNCNAPAANPGICRIIDSQERIGRCDNPGQFAPAGELCGPNTNECCPGVPEGKLYCHDTFFGVERCLLCKPKGTQCTDDAQCCGGHCAAGTCAGGDGGDSSCTADGSTCSTPDECCGRICTPDSKGALRCRSECVPVSGACTTDADCCTGNCFEGSCGDKQVNCVPLGGACSGPTLCCSQACVAGTCQTELI